MSASASASASARPSSSDVAEQCARHVLHELISTEQQYVEDLVSGIERYSHIFSPLPSLPVGLVGQQHVLLPYVTQIVKLHRYKLLPLMLQHRHQLELLFERWYALIDQDLFNCYVLFAASQRASLQLYHKHELYFKRLQIQLGDPLGIRSFLLKPVQRVTKYPLLLSRFIQAFYEHRQLISKRVFEVACRLETRLRELLERANQSDQLNDIKHFNALSILNEASFITVGEFQLNDGRLRRSYSCKLFAFNTCLIYTESKGRKQLLRGNFLLPDVCFVALSKSFLLCNKQRECEFLCQPAVLQKWETIVRQLLDQEPGPAPIERSGQHVQQQERDAISRTTWYALH
ncbi:triple functional domain protein-like [Drosophila novamexicana]|uniref:triple functional domain protein-like n=1 Tax=Drosophila novamexicana TaxID=47314 RepID=UPI0011E6070F|nr:triple functional domain protein-like [Drosophila novamexicana]